MNFTVVVTAQAEENADIIFRWIAKFSPSGATRWHQAYLAALKKLEEDPQRFSLAAESYRIEEPIRQAFFRTRKGLRYRLIFKIVELEVHVLYVRGYGQDEV